MSFNYMLYDKDEINDAIKKYAAQWSKDEPFCIDIPQLCEDDKLEQGRFKEPTSDDDKAIAVIEIYESYLPQTRPITLIAKPSEGIELDYLEQRIKRVYAETKELQKQTTKILWAGYVDRCAMYLFSNDSRLKG